MFKLSNKAVVGSLATGVDVQQCSVNNDFIFTATKCGIIEVWLKERITKIAYIKMDVGHARVTSIVSDAHGQKLFAGTSDGRLQVTSSTYFKPRIFRFNLHHHISTFVV